jgi:type IV pilus assembly protein PilA
MSSRAALLAALVLGVGVPLAQQDVTHSTEMAALRAIQIITSCQAVYRSEFGRYASSLAELGPSGANLIPASLALGQAGGYSFTLSGVDPRYILNAAPHTFGRDGKRTFYTDQTMIVRQNWGKEPASADSPEFK